MLFELLRAYQGTFKATDDNVAINELIAAAWSSESKGLGKIYQLLTHGTPAPKTLKQLGDDLLRAAQREHLNELVQYGIAIGVFDGTR